MGSRYLQHRADTTVYSLVQVLVDVVFPKQAKEYTTALTQASTSYRVPRYALPEYYLNRPPQIQGEVLRQISLSKRYHQNDIVDEGNGCYIVSDDRYNTINIPEGKIKHSMSKVRSRVIWIINLISTNLGKCSATTLRRV